MTRQEYRICAAGTAADLGREVTERLSQGWELHGFPFSDPAKNGNGNDPLHAPRYYQAMVRTAVVTAPKVAAVRPRVAANLRNVAAFAAVILCGYLVSEILIFRSGWYARFLQPTSAAGTVERVVANEQRRTPTGRTEILMLGNSRMAEGFSARLANGYKPEYGYEFVNLAIPATGCRAWYYVARDLDPRRNRYAAIMIPLDDYDDFDDYEDVADRAAEVSLLINRLRVTDIVPYTLSFTTWKSRYEVFRRLMLKGLEYQRDFQDFVEHPGKRLELAAEYRAHGQDWAYGYNGIERTLTGMQVDWEHERLTLPPGLPTDLQRSLADSLFHHPPQLGRNRAFEVRWLGALMDLYRGSKTKFIIFQVPRSPAPNPRPQVHLSWTAVDEFRKRESAIIVNRRAFESLEKPEYFADHVHLNSTGRTMFSPMVVDVVRQSLQ